MGFVTASVLIPASAASYLIDRLLLARYDVEYLWLVVTMVVIAALVQLVGIAYRAREPRVQPMLRLYLPLIITNCTILAIGVAGARPASRFARDADVCIGGVGRIHRRDPDVCRAERAY